MDLVHPTAEHRIKDIFRVVQQSLADGIVETTAKERRRFWKAWKDWMASSFPDIEAERFHQPRPVQIELLAAFGAHVRFGGVSEHYEQVRTETVQVALRAVTTKLELDGQQNPLVTAQGTYVPKIRQLLSGFRKFDGPPKCKLAIPILVLLWLRQQGILTQDAKYRAVGDMTIIAFFFLLRA